MAGRRTRGRAAPWSALRLIHSLIHSLPVALLAMALVTGCTSGGRHNLGTQGSVATTEASATSSADTSVDLGSSPPTEQDTVEATGGVVHKVSIAVPILVPGQGGGSTAPPQYQCMPLKWYGYSRTPAQPIPSDVIVSVTAISLGPKGIFEAGGDLTACGAASSVTPRCETSTTFTSTKPSCLLVVTQVAEADPELRVHVELKATATCVTVASCEAVQSLAAAGGERPYFQPIAGAVTGVSQPTSPDTSSPNTSSPTVSTESPTAPAESPTGS